MRTLVASAIWKAVQRPGRGTEEGARDEEEGGHVRHVKKAGLQVDAGENGYDEPAEGERKEILAGQRRNSMP